MTDIMLYTYPQQDGKYRLINTLVLTGMEVMYTYNSHIHIKQYNFTFLKLKLLKLLNVYLMFLYLSQVTRHLIENTQNALKIEVKDISITLLAR